MIERNDFCRHRTIGQGADLTRDFNEIPAGFGDQRWVGGHAVEQTSRRQILNIGNVSGIGKEFHGTVS